MDFTIRDARPSDGEFIARNVLAAMGYDVFPGAGSDQRIELGAVSVGVEEAVKAFGAICARPDTLYSFARTRIAWAQKEYGIKVHLVRFKRGQWEQNTL